MSLRGTVQAVQGECARWWEREKDRRERWLGEHRYRVRRRRHRRHFCQSLHHFMGMPFESSFGQRNAFIYCSNLAMAVYKLLGVRKVATTRTTPTAMNGGVERVNHTMAQMLAMVVNERQDD